MTAELLQKIVAEGLFPGVKTGISLLETHISWVILTDEFAFKIKKPLRFDFLDFSTLEQRAHFCAEELRLNRRLAPEMYLQLLPVTTHGIGAEDGAVLDFALQMKRMDNSREMDKLLMRGEVRQADLVCLAELLCTFHQANRLPPDHPYDPANDVRNFADLFAFKADLLALQVPESECLEDWRAFLPKFVHQYAARSKERIEQGFWVDGHGDLHSRNIFLPLGEKPVVFDCLEFSQHFRQIDVLNELAFLCMDLEFFGQTDLAAFFMETYAHCWNCMEKPEDRVLFAYFKAYRANVRLKISLLELRQRPDEHAVRNRALSYWQLLRGYMAKLPVAGTAHVPVF